MLAQQRRSSFLIAIFQSPTQTDNASKENHGAQGDKSGVKVGEPIALVEVDEAVYNGDDVVYAKDEGIKYACADKLESAMHIVELGQSKGDEADEDGPGLPAIELIVTVDYGADDELNSALCDEQGMGRKDSTDTAKEHTAKQP